MIREYLVEDEIDSTVLVDGLPKLSEDNIRRDLMKLLQSDFGVRPDLLAPIPYFTKQDVWRVVFPSPDDVAKVVDKTIKFRGVHKLSFVKPPLGKDGKGGALTSKNSSKKRKLSLEEDSAASAAAPPSKAAKLEESSSPAPDGKKSSSSSKNQKEKEKEKEKEREAEKSQSKAKKDKTTTDSKDKDSDSNQADEKTESMRLPRIPPRTSSDSRRSLKPSSSSDSSAATAAAFPSSATAEYAVDRIISSRSIVGGRKEYLLEAKLAESSSSADSTPLRLWFFDPELVAAVSGGSNSSIDGNHNKEASTKSSSAAAVDPTKMTLEELEALAPETPSFDEIEEVIGAKMIDRQLHLYVKWKGSSVASFLPASTAGKLAPQKVIRFYESNLQFSDSDAK